MLLKARMTAIRHTVATGGDVVLALSNPDQEFAVWDENLHYRSMIWVPKTSDRRRGSSQSTSEDDEDAPMEDASNEEPNEEPNEDAPN
jgi:hypothetical protein